MIVPSTLLQQELYCDHSGVWKMKAVACSYFWWPGLDKEIKQVASGCVECQSVKNAPLSAPLHPWVWLTKPWERVHLDFATPFQNTTFLVAVDAHSKWPEVFIMSSNNHRSVETVIYCLWIACSSGH